MQVWVRRLVKLWGGAPHRSRRCASLAALRSASRCSATLRAFGARVASRRSAPLRGAPRLKTVKIKKNGRKSWKKLEKKTNFFL